jgi:hypothetical protein
VSGALLQSRHAGKNQGRHALFGPQNDLPSSVRRHPASGEMKINLSGGADEVMYKSGLCTKMRLWPGFYAQVFRD